jgi:hypothetical protein
MLDQLLATLEVHAINPPAGRRRVA